MKINTEALSRLKDFVVELETTFLMAKKITNGKAGLAIVYVNSDKTCQLIKPFEADQFFKDLTLLTED